MKQSRTILCFGDSNTYGAVPTLARNGRHRFARDRRWTGVMARQFEHSWQVIEEGHPGRTTVHADPIEGSHKNGLTALPICLESHMPIDLVIVMLGTNDLKARFSVTAGDISDSIEVIIRAIHDSETSPNGNPPQVLIVIPPPLSEVGWFAEMFQGGAEKSLRLNPLIVEMCTRQRVPYLDAGSIIESSAIDGIHFDAEAHRALGMALAETCKGLFPD